MVAPTAADDFEYRFELWVGDYLGATAHSDLPDDVVALLNGSLEGGIWTAELGETATGEFLAALREGPLHEHRRWVLGLPLLARDWIGRYQDDDAADGPLRLVITRLAG